MTTKKIRFIADSTCDLPPEILQKWNITIIPAFVNYGGGSYADDGKELDRVAYYDQLSAMTSQPTTSAPASSTRAVHAIGSMVAWPRNGTL